MNGTPPILFTVACAVKMLLLAASMAMRVRRVVRSGQGVPALLRVQAFVMGGAVVLLVVLIGLQVVGS